MTCPSCAEARARIQELGEALTDRDLRIAELERACRLADRALEQAREMLVMLGPTAPEGGGDFAFVDLEAA